MLLFSTPPTSSAQPAFFFNFFHTIKFNHHLRSSTYGLTTPIAPSSCTAWIFWIFLVSFTRAILTITSLPVMPKLVSVHSSPCSVRCLLHAPSSSTSSLPKSSIPQVRTRRRAFVSSPVRPLAQPRHGVLGDPHPWFFQGPPTSFPTRFSQTGPLASLDGLDGYPRNNRGYKPPDERILKLGQSMFLSLMMVVRDVLT